MTTILVDIPSAMWLHSNQRLHRMQVAARTRDIRLLAKHASRDTAPVPGPVVLTVHVGYPPRVHRVDVPNAYPSIKAAIDGCVDSGVLTDDSSEVIVEHRFRRDPERTPRGTYRLTLHITTPCLQCHDPAPTERIEGICTACMKVEF